MILCNDTGKGRQVQEETVDDSFQALTNISRRFTTLYCCTRLHMHSCSYYYVFTFLLLSV